MSNGNKLYFNISQIIKQVHTLIKSYIGVFLCRIHRFIRAMKSVLVFRKVTLYRCELVLVKENYKHSLEMNQDWIKQTFIKYQIMSATRNDVQVHQSLSDTLSNIH